MKLFVVGFPKSGTTTLTMALEASGMKPVHWGDAGALRRSDHLRERPGRPRPARAAGSDYDAVTQADVCLPAHGINYWPNLDFAISRRSARHIPNACSCSTLATRKGLRQHRPLAEPARADRPRRIPGLPGGMGGTDKEMIRWIENHYAACRRFFADDPNFLEIDIESEEAPSILGKALGIIDRRLGDVKPDRQGRGPIAGGARVAPRAGGGGWSAAGSSRESISHLTQVSDSW